MTSKKEKDKRFLATLGQNSIKKKMTRKVDSYEYESLETCIQTEPVPPSEIAEIFTDKAFYKWYSKRNFT